MSGYGGTGIFRFDFQRAACAHATGVVLNIGANEDPAALRSTYGSKVVNTDLQAYDIGMGRPNVVDKVFDMGEFPWPFEDDYAHTVLFGDVLEHFTYVEMVKIMREGKRVAREMCITVPTDHRIDEAAEQAAWTAGEYNLHTTIVTEELLRSAIKEAGWVPYIFIEADWGFGCVPPVMGFGVMAYRMGETPPIDESNADSITEAAA